MESVFSDSICFMFLVRQLPKGRTPTYSILLQPLGDRLE